MIIVRLQYIIKHLFQLIPVLLGVSIITFLLIRMIPGDPALVMLGPRATPENIARLTVQMGLDQPMLTQYITYIRNVFSGDLGDSIIIRQPVFTLISERLGVTIFLVVYAAFLSVVISIPISLWSALRRNGVVDSSFRAASIIGLSMPSFWIGILLMLLFSIKVKWFPVSGYGDNFLQHLYHLTLPALTVSFSLSPVLIRPLRSKMISILSSDFIESARARGLSSWQVVIKHALRNAVIGMVTILGVNVGWLLGGSVVIETIFSLPGLGQLLINSILTRDYPVIQGLVLIFATLVILVNMLTDLVYTILDPRVHLE
ncbi:ABC transporter permease [Ammoniphilus sp. CFH 90114]|uniref:ABC transporter permease n=1 Tax=Ammoniphilus sp. CFH 90114 TaxID=2493665 RepID=UPI00100EBE09|nr:ABC transporter permease [Ammoniphilus sp. CFH 90114]RXT07906.1 ABC transporter permease [Ammoniphilus sp. CFH 90114]